MLPLVFLVGIVVGCLGSRALMLGAKPAEPDPRPRRLIALGFVPVSLAVLGLFRAYPHTYATIVGGLAAGVLLIGFLLVEKKVIRAGLLQLTQLSSAVIVVGIVAVEALLGMAALGLPPAQWPEFCWWLGGTRSGPALVGSLRVGDAAGRLRAIELLSATGTNVQKELLPYASDSKDMVRRAAFSVLTRRQEKSLIPMLARGVEDRDPSIRAACTDALFKLNDPAGVPALLRGAADPNGYGDHTKFLASLKKMGPVAAPVIAQELRRTDPVLRLGAIRAARESRAQATIDALAELTRDPDEQVRQMAVKTLGEIGADFRREEGMDLVNYYSGHMVSWDPNTPREVVDLNRIAAIMLERFSDPVKDVRIEALRGLGSAVDRKSQWGASEIDLGDPLYGAFPVDYARINAAVDRMAASTDPEIRRMVSSTRYHLEPPDLEIHSSYFGTVGAM
jgi:hypothetical protein